MVKTPVVSIIVPSYNSAQFIKKCLNSIKDQTYQNIKLIVVDKGSKDGTLDIARKYTENVFIHGPERAAQFNFGAKKARGKYLYRVDSDFVLDSSVVEECVEKCEKEKLDGIAVHNTSAEGLGFWADVRKFERNSYRDDSTFVAVRFFTKKAWDKVGEMDEALYGPEDYDFHNRFVQKGFKWGRILAIERHLGEPKSLWDIYRKHYWYGKQMLFYFKKHPSRATLQFNPVRPSFFRHYKAFISRPRVGIGLLIMTIVKFFAGGLGFFTALVTNYKPDFYDSKKNKNRN